MGGGRIYSALDIKLKSSTEQLNFHSPIVAREKKKSPTTASQRTGVRRVINKLFKWLFYNFFAACINDNKKKERSEAKGRAGYNMARGEVPEPQKCSFYTHSR
jgi:3-methyladenine DNA glycosylase Mpg